MLTKLKARIKWLVKDQSGEMAGWSAIIGVVIGLAIAVIVINVLTGGVSTLMPQVINKLTSFIGS